MAGKPVTSKREELGHILEQFNIQVDNPIAVLNQDTSRNFLHSTNPKHKYQVSTLMTKFSPSHGNLNFMNLHLKFHRSL